MTPCSENMLLLCGPFIRRTVCACLDGIWIQIPSPPLYVVHVMKCPYRNNMFSEQGVINDETYQKRQKSNSSLWWQPSPHWLRDVSDIASPDPDTIPTRAYSPSDERSTQQQHVLRTWCHQWWNLSKTTNIKFVTLVTTPPHWLRDVSPEHLRL